jgi:glucose/arabinose dehydrogenase
LSYRSAAALIGAVTTSASFAITGSVGAQPPPPPTASNGQTVTVLAHGIPTPTAFAFAGSTVFAGSGPDESGKAEGGLFVVANGAAAKVPNTPAVVFGLAWHKDTLYLSAGKQLFAYTGWNGTQFATSKLIYNGKKSFPGFNGLAWGPDGRLYAGISLRSMKYDRKKDPSKYGNSIVSLKPNGTDLRVIARGLRQPFQLTFLKGGHHPYAGVLGQDSAKIPPDEIVQAKSGQDYGFPTCTHLVASKCASFTKPFRLLPKHASPMGVGAIGSTLYVSLFGGTTGKNPEVVTISTKTRKLKPFVTGFVAPVIALGINAGTVYFGDLTGTVYSVLAG